MSPERKKQLLLILALLLAIKFVGQPLVEWQNSKVNDVTQASQRLTKMNEVLLGQEQIQQQLAMAKKNNETLKAQFPVASNSSDFRLQAQQRISQLAAEYELSVDMFNWAGDAPVPIEGFTGLALTTEVAGPVLNIAQFHAAVNSELGFLIMETSELSFRGALTKSKVGRFQIRAVAVFKNSETTSGNTQTSGEV